MNQDPFRAYATLDPASDRDPDWGWNEDELFEALDSRSGSRLPLLDPAWGLRGPLVAVAAMALVVLVGLVVTWAIGGSGDVVTPDVSTPVSLPAPVTSETVATTAAPAPAPAADTHAETGLGRLVWTELSGTEQNLPRGFQADPEGGFVSYEGSKVWRSDDAITWRVGASERPDRYVAMFVEGEWALGSTSLGPRPETILLRRQGDGWGRIDLPAPELPAVPGVEWGGWPRWPVSSAATTLVPFTGYGKVAWEQHYGTSPQECGLDEPCMVTPWPFWDEPSGTLRLMEHGSNDPVAVLTIEVADDRVVLSDWETGDVVHEIQATPEYPVETLLEVARGRDLLFLGAWVATDGGRFEFATVPWSAEPSVVSLREGGFAAYVLDHAAPRPLDPSAATVWTSPDGIDWVGLGSPAFLEGIAGFEHMEVVDTPLGLRAVVVTGFDPGTGGETFATFESNDGLTWRAAEDGLTVGPRAAIEATTFGYAATDMPQSTHHFWISADGETWEEVPGPPGPHVPDGAGYSAAGAAGDVLYVAVGGDAGERTLWIGRLEE